MEVLSWSEIMQQLWGKIRESLGWAVLLWGLYTGATVAWRQGALAPYGFPPPQPPQKTDGDNQDASSDAAKNSENEPVDAETAAAHKVAVDRLTNRAMQHCKKMNDDKLTLDHMVLALAEEQRFAEILQCAEGLSEEQIKQAIKKSRLLFNRGTVNEELCEPPPSALSKYSRDLTDLARRGLLDPLMGRADEMRRVINVLCRRTKNNPVVLGEPGVGKTALVEGLAARIAAGDVPDALKGASLVALDMGLLMAGAFMPGEFEERMKAVLKELTEGSGAAGGSSTSSGGDSCCSRYILFIDDLHNVTGPNASQGGGVMDASILLKPLLGRGELRCIGATTQDKFRRFIEKDPALERRFQQVPIEQPSVGDTVSILRGLRPRYEKHHAVRISDSALMAAANLSHRYMPDRYLPDKAIDLVDEATARVKLEITLKPEALDRVERRIASLEAERRLLRRSAPHSRSDASALGAVEEELRGLKEERTRIFEQYTLEVGEVNELIAIQDEIDTLAEEIEAAEDAGDPEGAAVAKAAKREELVKKMRSIQAVVRERSGARGRGSTPAILSGRGAVGESDVARVISAWTGIPLTKLVESEVDKLLHLTDELHKRIVGQHEAVEAVAEAIQRSRAGMKDPNGPIASFLFLGPTGVGKTELAKALATYLFNSEESMVRLDMSEYMEKHAVSKLIGAPPGYIGFDEGGQLTEKVRHRPYCVILLDEVEKAHVDVFNLLLQILDDGRVTDAQGRVVSFKNAVIIMTSNLGSAEIFRHQGTQQAGAGADGANKSVMKELVMEQVRRHFRPEFVNRVDEFIIFEPLQAHQIHHIVRLRARGITSRLGEKRIEMVLRESAVDHLSVRGFDPVFGGRPVKRALQRELETPLAQALLRGDFHEEDTIVVGTDGSRLVFQRFPPGTTVPPEEQAQSSGSGSKQQEQQQQAASAVAEANGIAAGAGSKAQEQEEAKQSSDSKAAPKVVALPPPRALKFDPLGGISALQRKGVDISNDGHAARNDPDTLPTDSC